MSKKVIVTGASGLLGRAVLKEFKDANWQALGLAFTRARGELISMDLTNTAEAINLILEYQPDVLIHCAAQRSPDKLEKESEATHKLNVESVWDLAQISANRNIIFVYVSTDYVFDGRNPPFREEDCPRPLNGNLYGISKLEGELAAKNANQDSIILRIPVLYGGEEYVGESAVSALIKELQKKEPVKVSNYEIRFPSHTADIATIIFKLVEKRLDDPSIRRIYHWCGPDGLTKYEMIKVIAEKLDLSYDHIIPDDQPTPGAPPKNTQLSCRKITSLNIGVLTFFDAGVEKSFKALSVGPLVP